MQLKGIYPPLPTPFDKNGQFSDTALQENINALNPFDLRGYIVLGSNGEFVLLSRNEKTQVMEVARQHIPSEKLMIAGTGCQSTAETLELTKTAASLGADAALVLPPHYYRGLMKPEVLINHFFTVADSSEIPILIYNMPACTGLDLDADTILSLAEHDNIIGLKDSGGNIVKIGFLNNQVKGFQILAGSGGFLLPALSVGAVGGVLALANIAPGQCLAIQELFFQGKTEEARQIQNKMIPVNTAITSKWGVPALKFALDYLGLYGGPVRLPLLPPTPEIKSKLEVILQKGQIKHFNQK